MIKLTVMYPTTPGARFDHDYYRDRHLPLLQARLGAACKGYTISKGISGGAPGTEPPYVATCDIFFESLTSFEQAFAPHVQEIRGDIPNYTDISPIRQISDVVV